MKIRNETGPNLPDIWLQNRLLRKKEKTAMERSFCRHGKFFFSEKGLLHWLLSLCNSPFCENLFSKSTQKLVSPKLTSSA